jgi:hypothetical protein
MGLSFKPELLEKVLAGTKTQTRRLVKRGEAIAELNGVFAVYFTVANRSRIKWQVGRKYAVVPGRGKPGQGFIRLKKIRFELVDEITEDDAIAEGFDNIVAFYEAWNRINPNAWHDTAVWALEFEVIKP